MNQQNWLTYVQWLSNCESRPRDDEYFEAGLNHARRQQVANSEAVKGVVKALEAARSEMRRLLDAKGVEPKEILGWPEIVAIDAALAAYKEATKS